MKNKYEINDARYIHITFQCFNFVPLSGTILFLKRAFITFIWNISFIYNCNVNTYSDFFNSEIFKEYSREYMLSRVLLALYQKTTTTSWNIIGGTFENIRFFFNFQLLTKKTTRRLTRARTKYFSLFFSLRIREGA